MAEKFRQVFGLYKDDECVGGSKTMYGAAQILSSTGGIEQHLVELEDGTLATMFCVIVQKGSVLV